MSTSITHTQILQLKRDAQRAQHTNGTSRAIELDAIAQRRGFPNWSSLMKSQSDGASNQIIVPHLVFSRTPAEMRLSMLKPKDWSYWKDRSGDVVRARVKDLSTSYNSWREGMDFAIAYLECMLQVPKFYMHRHAEAYYEMRCWLPYCLEQVSDGLWIFVGRDYKPLGMTQKEDRVRYEDYPQLHVRISAQELAKIQPPTDTHSSAYFYNRTPWSTRTGATKHLDRLLMFRQWAMKNGR